MRLRNLVIAVVLAAAPPALAESGQAAPTNKERIDQLVAGIKLAYLRQDALSIVAQTDALRRLAYLPASVYLFEARAAIMLGQPLFAKYLYDEYFLRAEAGDEGFDEAKAEQKAVSPAADAELKAERDAAAEGNRALGKVTPPHTDPATPPIQPEYPADVRDAGQAGRVVLELFVGRDGRVYEGRIKTSSGIERLDKFALGTALTAWHFQPGTNDGKPLAMWMPFAARFEVDAPAPPTGKKPG